jgi:hypothetical protein
MVDHRGKYVYEIGRSQGEIRIHICDVSAECCW